MAKTSQQRFLVCQKCHQLVDKVYQKGYCKSCLSEHFKSLQSVLNSSHANYQADTNLSGSHGA